MSGNAVDQVARDDAKTALEKIGAHEDLCAERYGNIHDKLGLVLKVLGWGGATLMTAMIGTVGFFAAHAWTGNDDQQAYLRAKIDLLQQQVHGPPAAEPAR